MKKKQSNYKIPTDEPRVNNLLFDPKSEILQTCFLLSKDPGKTMDGAYVINPLDRCTVGYDPFWCITPKSKQNLIRRHMKTVCESIITIKSNDKGDKFWKRMARSMLHGFMGYFYIYHNHRCLPQICRAILASGSLDSLLKQVLSEVPQSSFIYADLNVFCGMAAETLYSVFANVHDAILDFCADDDIVYCLEDNPRKVNPTTLLQHTIILGIPLDYLESYAPLIVLIYNQTIRWVLGLPEKKEDPDRAYIGLILDETVALLNAVGGEIAALAQALRLQRSKGVTMMLCVQSISGLKTIMDNTVVNDELSNIPWKIFLDCTTPEDQKMICDWGGKFSRRKTSYTKNGSNNNSENVHFDDDNLITPAQLMTLGGSGESILISTKSGYNRFKKVYTFKDKFYKKQMSFVEKHNKQIMKRRNRS